MAKLIIKKSNKDKPSKKTDVVQKQNNESFWEMQYSKMYNSLNNPSIKVDKSNDLKPSDEHEFDKDGDFRTFKK